MPRKPLQPCKSPGCHGLTWERFCADCVAAGKAKETRANSYQRGYTREWNEYAKGFISTHRFCADPRQIHLISAIAQVVDHKIPHKGDEELFWNPANHQALCKSCHDFKTATQDGGFGRSHSPLIR